MKLTDNSSSKIFILFSRSKSSMLSCDSAEKHLAIWDDWLSRPAKMLRRRIIIYFLADFNIENYFTFEILPQNVFLFTSEIHHHGMLKF